VNTANIAEVMLDVEGRTVGVAAHMLAEAGLPVFPCRPGGKTPLIAHGFRDATTDRRLIGGWWRAWPKANIGMPTGPVSQLDVVDIDVRPTGDGRDMFQQVKDVCGANRWVFQVGTPSGGLHLYYPADPARPQSSWVCSGAHVDFRGAGGYVIVPPSKITTTDGQAASYRLTATRCGDAAPVDATKLRRLLDPTRTQQQTWAGPPQASRRLDTARLAGWVASRPKGERNQCLYWAVRRLAEAGHGLDHALSVLGPPANQSGLDDKEIRATITSAYRHTRPNPAMTLSGTSFNMSPAPCCACGVVAL